MLPIRMELIVFFAALALAGGGSLATIVDGSSDIQIKSVETQNQTDREKPHPVSERSEPDPSDENTFGSDRQVVYKKIEDAKDLKLFFFVPEHKPKPNDSSQLKVESRPAIVFFFGGGWVGGTPAQFAPHAQYLKSRGMIAVLADYRTKGSHGTSPIECVKDAKSAVRFLRQNASELGIDPNRIVASGGSAGGHIATATATVQSFDDESDDLDVSPIPNALVLFNPVYDNGPDQWGHAKVKDYWQKISPANNIQKGMPPAIVFLGDNDKLIPVATANSFQAKMKKVGSRSDLHIYEEQGHGFFNHGRGKGEMFRDTVKKTDRFLIETGFLSGRETVDSFMESFEKSTPRQKK